MGSMGHTVLRCALKLRRVVSPLEAHVASTADVQHRSSGCVMMQEEVTGMATGTVKWFNAEKGYGFIAPDDGGDDVFAHYSAIATEGFRTLEENQKVSFEVKQGPKGLQAEDIRPL